MIDQHIGKRLTEAREASGTSIEDAASALEISADGYSAMENGKTRINALSLAKLSRLFGYSISWFYLGLPGQTVFEDTKSSK